MANYRRIRKALNLNQVEFWKSVGVKQSSGSRYENNECEVPMPVRMLLKCKYPKYNFDEELFDYHWNNDEETN